MLPNSVIITHAVPSRSSLHPLPPFPPLSELHLYDNPLEFLPEISPCARLRHLTVANLRVTSDHGYTKFKAEVLAPPPSSGGGGLTASISLWDSSKQAADKLRPIFALMLRRSSGHHPLLAGALRECVAVRGGGRGQSAGPADVSGWCIARGADPLPSCEYARYTHPAALRCAAPAVLVQACWRRRTQRTGR